MKDLDDWKQNRHAREESKTNDKTGEALEKLDAKFIE